MRCVRWCISLGHTLSEVHTSFEVNASSAPQLVNTTIHQTLSAGRPFFSALHEIRFHALTHYRNPEPAEQHMHLCVEVVLVDSN